MAPENAKMVIADVDGVLTDGIIGLNERGEEFKHFSVQDGLGVRLLQKAGIAVGFLSSRESPIVGLRAESLGVRLHFSGVREKRPKLEEILDSARLESGERVGAAEVCYIGDDLVDIPCLRIVGFPVAVANARQEVKEHAAYVTKAAGGQGAFREVAELILKAQGLWEPLLETFR